MSALHIREKKEFIYHNLELIKVHFPEEKGQFLTSTFKGGIDLLEDEMEINYNETAKKSDMFILTDKFQQSIDLMKIKFEAVDKRFESIEKRFYSLHVILGLGFAALTFLMSVYSK